MITSEFKPCYRLFETLIGDNFIPIFGYVRCGYGYGYGYGYLGMKRPGIPNMGIGMGIPEPGVVLQEPVKMKIS